MSDDGAPVCEHTILVEDSVPVLRVSYMLPDLDLGQGSASEKTTRWPQ